METLLRGAVFVFGLVVGSFVNVVGLRLPQKQSILGRSHCDACQRTLTFRELIPVFSFLAQKGRCLRCGAPLSWQYPMIELLVGLWFVAVFLATGGALFFLDSLFLTLYLWLLGAIFFAIIIADVLFQIIPDELLVAALGVVLVWLAAGLLGAWPQGQVIDWPLVYKRVLSALGAAGFLGFLWALTRGQGMGLGDVKLAVVMGLILGGSGVIAALFVSFVVGALVGVGLVAFGGKTLKSKLPFGPFLAGSTLLVLLFKLTFPNLFLF